MSIVLCPYLEFIQQDVLEVILEPGPEYRSTPPANGPTGQGVNPDRFDLTYDIIGIV